MQATLRSLFRMQRSLRLITDEARQRIDPRQIDLARDGRMRQQAGVHIDILQIHAASFLVGQKLFQARLLSLRKLLVAQRRE